MVQSGRGDARIRWTDPATHECCIYLCLPFKPDDSGEIGGRDHLRKILEHELWTFWETYHLLSSECGLTQLVHTHLKLEELPMKGVTPVKRWDGTSGRVDLHLAAQYKAHDHITLLVVELKAPSVTLTQTDLGVESCTRGEFFGYRHPTMGRNRH